VRNFLPLRPIFVGTIVARLGKTSLKIKIRIVKISILPQITYVATPFLLRNFYVDLDPITVRLIARYSPSRLALPVVALVGLSMLIRQGPDSG